MDEAAQKIEEAEQELRAFKAGQDVFDAVTTLEEASNAIVEAQA